jgi:nucleoside-diphosphate-sugar epimerase
MANILITGITGLLGSHLSEELFKFGHNVYGVTRSISKASYETVNIDLSTDWKISELPANIDAVYHLAQSDKFRDFPSGAPDVFQVNVNSTAKLLNYCRQSGVKKFIYASTGGVYGNGNKPFEEDTPIVPIGELGFYLGSKACGEILAHSYASEFQVIIIRPFFIYGKDQNRSMLIPRLFDNVASGRPIHLIGEEGIRINPIHVDDAVKVLFATLTSSSTLTYNMGGPDIFSIRQICDLFGGHLSKSPYFKNITGSPMDIIGDISLMSEKLYKPKIKLSETFLDLEKNSSI